MNMCTAGALGYDGSVRQRRRQRYCCAIVPLALLGKTILIRYKTGYVYLGLVKELALLDACVWSTTVLTVCAGRRYEEKQACEIPGMSFQSDDTDKDLRLPIRMFGFSHLKRGPQTLACRVK